MAIFLATALFDANHHPLTIDVEVGSRMDGLENAPGLQRSKRWGRAVQGLAPQAAGNQTPLPGSWRREASRVFFAVGNHLVDPNSVPRRGVMGKPRRRYCGGDRTRGQLSIVGQVNLGKSEDVTPGPGASGDLLKIACEQRHLLRVGGLACSGEIPHQHVLGRPFAEGVFARDGPSCESGSAAATQRRPSFRNGTPTSTPATPRDTAIDWPPPPKLLVRRTYRGAV